ncbi:MULTISPECIES: hypothetical protein [unclassified Ensifer]|uniref:hypothetical protein n=1 Tax=unclassified Ensifer TaxID=2633371 RepID=UPI000813B548|nr:MULTISPECIES: hypothetical protein [unclassified Ensifer]OCO98680.1 hypothetical protein BC362_28360 [Ensifer sp. LC14]OCP13159.1 hypothetical protein BC374_12975 [Ensifer sp. LC13]OCP13764.1 hypothetical protein BBX50_13255 [Ensifer sp. LC11]OCP28140.1 hypothetical protein BC364_11375 [Ensifer sp. LC499]
MTSFHHALALSTLALAIGLSAVPAAAQTYRDLPGVRQMDPLNGAGDKVVCEQTFVDRNYPFESTARGRPIYDTIYNCRRGDGPVFQGSDLPPSLYRQKRGLGY